MGALEDRDHVEANALLYTKGMICTCTMVFPMPEFRNNPRGHPPKRRLLNISPNKKYSGTFDSEHYIGCVAQVQEY
eukprot:4337004-Amphidinium_carterae.1